MFRYRKKTLTVCRRYKLAYKNRDMCGRKCSVSVLNKKCTYLIIGMFTNDGAERKGIVQTYNNNINVVNIHNTIKIK